MSTIALTLPNSGLEDPVYVDMLSGYVYAIGKQRLSRQRDTITLKGIPVGDWPILIAHSHAFGWHRTSQDEDRD